MENNFLGLDDAGFDASSGHVNNYLEDAPELPGEGAPPIVSNSKRVDLFDQSFAKASLDAQQEKQPLFEVTSYDPKLKERYKSDPSIYNDYFDPSADNERVATENWDNWDAMSSALGRFKDSFSTAFSESLNVWPRAAKALFNMNADYLMPSQNELDKMAIAQEKVNMENPIFYAPGTEDDFLTKGFLVESFGSLGFTLGTLGEVATEFAVTTAVSAMLGPAGIATEAVGVTRAASKMGTVWNNLKTLFVGSATDDVLKASTLTRTGLETKGALDASKVTVQNLRTVNAQANVGLNGVRNGINLWDNSLKIASKIPFVGQVADATRLMNAARTAELTSVELMKIGAGGLRRAFAEWQMAAGEASIEAGGNYASTLGVLLDEYKSKNNGEEPIGSDLFQLKDLAMKSSTADFATNIAILGITNKIQWGNIIGKFNFDSKVLTQLRNAVSENATKSASILAVQSASKTKLYEKGFLGTIGLLPKISADFSRRQAIWEVGRSTLKGLTRIELSEGLQENMQEASGEALTNYYADIYKKGYANLGSAFRESAENQFTKKGAKTFMMGALTGLFVHPIISTVQYAGDRGGFNPNVKKHRESVKQSIQTLNTYYDSRHKIVVNKQIKQIKLQSMFNDGMIEGLSTKDKYQYLNNRDSALIQAIMHAKRTGTLDYFNNFTRGYGENFTDEELKSAFGGTSQEFGVGSPKEVLNEIANSTERFSNLYDKYQEKFGLFLGVSDLIGNPAARDKYEIRKAALMDAITTVAFIDAKSQQTMTRAKSLLSSIASKYPSIGNSLSTSWNTIVSPEDLDQQLAIIDNEIKVMQDGTATPQTTNIIRDKIKEKLLLTQLKDSIYEQKKIQDPTDPTRTISTYDVVNNSTSQRKYIASVLSEYLQLKENQKRGAPGFNTISADEVNSSIDDILDYIKLGQDHNEYVQSVNMLNDPDNFTAYYERAMDARAGAVARSLYDDYMTLGSISEVAKEWLDSKEDLLKELLDFSRTPVGTFKNFMKFKEIKQQFTKDSDELLMMLVKQEAEKSKVEEEKVKAEAIFAQSRLPVSIIELFNDPDTLSQAQDYMTMRYKLDEIKDSFPFNSEDSLNRKITRYYLDNAGQRVAFNDVVTVPLEFDFSDDNGPVKLDNYDVVYVFLILVEEKNYINYTQKQTANAKQTDQKTQEVDNEKSKLINYVGTDVTISGETGPLTIQNDNFVISLPDRSIILGPVSDTATVDDFADVSIAYETQPLENKTVVSPTPNPVVDVQQSGTVTIVMDQNLEIVTINGVTWNIETDETGLAVAFNRTYTRVKNKKKKIFVERLSGKNPKAQDYIKRVNSILQFATKPLSTDLQELIEESEELDQLISVIDKTIQDESEQVKKSDEILSQYRVNKIKNIESTPRIIELKAKFGNPVTRKDVTRDELMELFMWASELKNKIKKEFSIYISNPVINGELTELEKEYINPISQIIDTNGQPKSKSRAATKRSTAKKTRGEKPTQTRERRKGKRDNEGVSEQTKPKKVTARKLSKSVKNVEDKADQAIGKQPTVTLVNVVADKNQKLPTNKGNSLINKVGASRIAATKNSIKSPEVIVTEEDPFNNLNNKTSCET